MIRQIVFVRHAEPRIDPELPPNRWELSDVGREAAREVIDKIPPGALLVSSPEPKAWQTLDPEGQEYAYRDERFAEVSRPDDILPPAEFRSTVHAYLRGTVSEGWEEPLQVVERFDEGLVDAEAHADGRPVVVATHGTALTTWLAARVGLPDAVAFWDDLRMPDVLAVDVDGASITRIPL